MLQRTAGSRRRARRGRRGRRQSGSSWRRRWGLRLLAAAFLLGTAVLLATYLQVRLTFHTRLGESPARIYSDRLVLSPGLRLAAAELESELVSRGYRRSDQSPPLPGRFHRRGEEIEIWVRDGPSSAKRTGGYGARVRFRGQQIARLEMFPGGRDLDVVTLAPRLLGLYRDRHHAIRVPIRLREAPDHLVRAVLELEDRRFHHHAGIDPRGLLRAAWHDVRAGDLVQGGSTITQQVVKNVLLSPERSVARKVRELIMAPMLETMLSKDEILEIYLNEIYLGQKGSRAVVGVGAGARFYFGCEAADLDLAQAALVAGLIRSPGTYNPWAHPEAARRRRSDVLQRLAAVGAISGEAAASAAARPLDLVDSLAETMPESDYFLDFVRRKLRESYGRQTLQREGVRFITTLDTRVQRAAARVLANGLVRLEAEPSVARRVGDAGLQGAVVVINPASGALLAMVGGKEFASSMFNRAVEARRQVGSLFKPFVYLAAFDAAARGDAGGLTPASLLVDEPITVGGPGRSWSPVNSDGRFRGPVPVREALAASINVPAVRAAQGVGVDRVADVAIACGFPPEIPRVPALALGSAEATPLEVAVAFSTLAGGGARPMPRWLRTVVSADGGSVDRLDGASVPAVGPEATYLVVSLMQEVMRSGTARQVGQAGFRGEVAGKTGTTNDRRDAWFVGFTPDFLAAVWVGADDNRPIGLVGAQAALPIWLQLVRTVGADAGLTFSVPAGVVFRRIDPATGALAAPRCPRILEQAFIRGTEPRSDCPDHPRRKFWRRLVGR
jgi:penicillin-binding protein 1B